MRKLFCLFACFGLLVGSQAITGCAGLGALLLIDQIKDATDGGGDDDNDFRGRYTGSFVASNGQTGTVSLEVDDDGDFDGTGRNDTLGADFTLSGELNDDGRITEGTLVMAGVTYELEGDFDRSGSAITGSIAQINGDQTTMSEFNLVRQ